MNPAEWWLVYGSCAPELQSIAIRVLSQTTSASNCERNWSTFSYIHTKTRNRLKYKKLQKLVFTFYNMKLKMRHMKRNSQEEIENSFNPINLDYIFHEDDPLAPWLEEREGPLLDGLQNADWLPRIDTEDEDTETDDGDEDDESNSKGDSHGTDGGLSPPSNNSGGGAAENVHGIDEYREQDPYQDIPYSMRNQGFCIDMTTFQGTRLAERGGGQPEDSISSNFSQSFSDFGIGESSQSSQDQYPPSYQQPFYQAPSYYQPMNYQEPNYYRPPNFSHYQEMEQGRGFFDSIFGQTARQGDAESETRGYDPPRHSTMW